MEREEENISFRILFLDCFVKKLGCMACDSYEEWFVPDEQGHIHDHMKECTLRKSANLLSTW